MSGTAIPVTVIVMSGVFLTAVAWKVFDLAMHAMSLDRDQPDHPTDPEPTGDEPALR